MATILQLLNADPNLSMFSHGIKIAELESKLNESGPFTILGPVNFAFALSKVASMSFEQLLEPANRAKLQDVLSGYILTGKQMMGNFRNDQKLLSLNGKQVVVTVKNNETLINGAKILTRDRQGSNGVIHSLGNTYAVAETI
jgi:uncharacterized surface protein with fasciclin (FAS1) repeats